MRLPTVPAAKRHFLQQAKHAWDQSVCVCVGVWVCECVSTGCHWSLQAYMQKQLKARCMKRQRQWRRIVKGGERADSGLFVHVCITLLASNAHNKQHRTEVYITLRERQRILHEASPTSIKVPHVCCSLLYDSRLNTVATIALTRKLLTTILSPKTYRNALANVSDTKCIGKNMYNYQDDQDQLH